MKDKALQKTLRRNYVRAEIAADGAARELIDVIDTLRQEETPQETEALRRVDAERERLTERRRFWRVLRGTVSTLIVVAAIAVLLATLLLPVLQVSGDSMNPTLQDRDV